MAVKIRKQSKCNDIRRQKGRRRAWRRHSISNGKHQAMASNRVCEKSKNRWRGSVKAWHDNDISSSIINSMARQASRQKKAACALYQTRTPPRTRRAPHSFAKLSIALPA